MLRSRASMSMLSTPLSSSRTIQYQGIPAAAYSAFFSTVSVRPRPEMTSTASRTRCAGRGLNPSGAQRNSPTSGRRIVASGSSQRITSKSVSASRQSEYRAEWRTAACSTMLASLRVIFWCSRDGDSHRTAWPLTTSTWRQKSSGSFFQSSTVIGSACRRGAHPKVSDMQSSLGVAGEGEGSLGDDVELDLRGAAADGEGAGGEDHPAPVRVQRVERPAELGDRLSVPHAEELPD